MIYTDYLQTEHWKKLRKKKFQKQGGCCCTCGTTKNLQAHHIKYGNLFDITTKDLRILCKRCHKLLHWVKRVDWDFIADWHNNTWREMNDINSEYCPNIDKLLVSVRRILRNPRVVATIKFREYINEFRKTEKKQQSVPTFCRR